MVNAVLHEEWRARLESFSQAGKTVSAWCAEQEIPVHQFHYWRRRLADLSTPPEGPAPHDGWLAVAVVPESAPGGVTIRVGGAAIEVHPGFDVALLRAVVQALGSAPC